MDSIYRHENHHRRFLLLLSSERDDDDDFDDAKRRRRRRGRSVLVTNVARSKGLRRRSKDGPNRSGKVSFFITVTRRRNSKSNGMDANTK